MAYPDIIDFDKITLQALGVVDKAISGWLNGQPHEEVALLNRITEQLSRRRRNCDVGVTAPIAMESEAYQLHRRGNQGQDKYGSDLAITISVPELRWIKTALFQLKRSNNTSVVVEKHQIQEAARDNRIFKRAFVIAVDEQRSLIRIESAGKLLDVLRERGTDQKTHKIECSDWDGLVFWFHQWLRCDVGEISEHDDPNGVESLLQSYALEPTRAEHFGIQPINQMEDHLPARFWMRLLFRGTPIQEELDLKRRST